MVQGKMIYDCFMFYNEVELLDLRLRTLREYVDVFVLAEINITHSGKDKPYYFDEFKSLFKEYNIIHLKDIAYPNDNPWIVENAHRNMLQRGYTDAYHDDYIIISDLDEIPDPQKVHEGIESGLNTFGIHQELYCYYINCKSDQIWAGSVVSKRQYIKSPQDARNNRCNQPVNLVGGWHYTSMGGKDRIRLKFDSFAETDFNIDKYMSDSNLDECLSTGKDLTGRTESYFQKRFITEDEITHKEVLTWKNDYPNFWK